VRYMLLLKGDPPADGQPSEEIIEAMARFNDEMHNAGVLLAAEGLYPSSYGSRVISRDGRRSVVDGPFTESKELIAGFMLIQVRSHEEAVEWAKRCPVDVAAGPGVDAVVEVRRVAEIEELTEITEDQLAASRQLRDDLAGG
jgi:hypothetical protein